MCVCVVRCAFLSSLAVEGACHENHLTLACFRILIIAGAAMQLLYQSKNLNVLHPAPDLSISIEGNM